MALVITIIVMLILVGVTVTVAINGGLFDQAKKAAKGYQQEALNEANETVVVDGVEYASVEDYMNGNRVYKPDGWIMAWTCSDGGTWSDTINAGEKAEGDIVAKLYTTGRRIKPDGFTFNFQNFTFNEGDEYHLVIEGSGTMGALMTTSGSTITGATGWHKSTALYMAGASDTCIMPYVSKVIVGTGIKNVGGYAFAGDTGLKEIILPNSITSINEYSFMYCTNLSNITIPEKVTNIGVQAFYACKNLKEIILPNSITSINKNSFTYCTNLSSITIPEKVTNIDFQAFYGCTNLIKVKILATDTTVRTDAFRHIAHNSKIYVLNESMKARVNEKIDYSLTTVEIVTNEQMKSL
ncbi:putative uncharacterized protein [Clostridium sp. CAG:452]|nr:putative uncharacterized protein [Clostridium sp. CAG:452]